MSDYVPHVSWGNFQVRVEQRAPPQTELSSGCGRWGAARNHGQPFVPTHSVRTSLSLAGNMNYELLATPTSAQRSLLASVLRTTAGRLRGPYGLL